MKTKKSPEIVMWDGSYPVSLFIPHDVASSEDVAIPLSKKQVLAVFQILGDFILSKKLKIDEDLEETLDDILRLNI